MENINRDHMKLLVVGGTGFIGRSLVKKAIEQGYFVTVISLNKPVEDKCVDGAKYLYADITNREELKQQLKKYKFEYIVNLSGYIDHSNFSAGGRKAIDVHFIGLLNLLEIIDLDRLKRFVQVGSSDEYGNLPAPQNEEQREMPISPYSLGKVASTQLLQMLYRTEKLPSVILRLFLVYGPGQGMGRFIPQIIKGCISGDKFPVSQGEQLRDFCFIDDIVRGILMTFKRDKVGGEVINLASGKPVTIKSVINEVVNVVGKGAPDYGKVQYRTGENMKLYADISKAEILLGWKAGITLRNGIQKTVDAYNSSLDLKPRG